MKKKKNILNYEQYDSFCKLAGISKSKVSSLFAYREFVLSEPQAC